MKSKTPLTATMMTQAIPRPDIGLGVDVLGEVKAFAYRFDNRLKKWVKYHQRQPDDKEIEHICAACMRVGIERLYPSLHDIYKANVKELIRRWSEAVGH